VVAPISRKNLHSKEYKEYIRSEIIQNKKYFSTFSTERLTRGIT
jgi:hypothetical protein